MRIGDFLYFAPGIKFSDVDVASGQELPHQFERRIRGYYLEPSFTASENGHAFAAGLLLVSCIDALARVQGGGGRDTDKRFAKWCRENLPCFKNGYSKRFYLDFRNGLMHEARIKRGSEFTFEMDEAVAQRDSRLSINPKLLGEEIAEALTRFIAEFGENEVKRRDFLEYIKKEFSYELSN